MKQLFGLIFCLIVSTQLLAAEYLPIPIPDRTLDVTKNYDSQILKTDSNKRSQELINELRNYKVLLVPGFYFEFFGRVYDPQMAWFEAHRINYVFADIDSGGTVAANSQSIIDEILNSKQKVIIFAQSKGGLDSLEALIQMSNEQIKDHVQAYVSLQAPFHGTPLADFAEDYYAGPIRFFVESILGGTRQSISAMTIQKRLVYNKTHEQKLKWLQANLPMIHFSSWQPLGFFGLPQEQLIGLGTKMGLTFSNRFISDLGYKNDGVVPLNSGCLPYSRCVIKTGVDHANTVLDTNNGSFDSISMTRTLFSFVLGH